jgi:mRNA interferase MazF
MMRRGDVVVINFPYSDGTGSKVRPALVVQNDADNQRLKNTIAAMITGDIRHVHEATQLLVDPTTPAGANSGLSGPSAVKCAVLVTVNQQTIIQSIGSLPTATMKQIDGCLKAALGIP